MEETAEKTAEKTSTWLALQNPVFRRLWLAMVISGSCIGAHNTAIRVRGLAAIGIVKGKPFGLDQINANSYSGIHRQPE